MKVKRIVNSFYTSNTFIISDVDSDYVWLVDCGDYWQVREILNGRSVRGVLLTHTHVDHIYGLNELLSDFSDAIIYTNEFGVMALSNPKLNVSKYHTEVLDFVIDPSARTCTLAEGNEVELFPSVMVQVLSTPGHDKSCLSYIIEENLFTGDSYIPGEKLIALFPNSNKADATESYVRLQWFENKFIICPGHGLRKRKQYLNGNTKI